MTVVSFADFVSFDLPAILTALCTALTCALLGSILVVRKQSLMGDAISHSVLPGIVIAFLISGSRDSFTVFVGAALAGILAALAIGAVKSLGRLDSGAAMGVVFSLFFAAGVVLIEQAAARNVDLDADCLLHGQLEHIFWFPPDTRFRLSDIFLLPTELLLSVVVAALCSAAVLVFYKEWKLISFDAGLAKSLGLPVGIMELFFLVLLAMAIVSSFYVVGTILVVALLICPGASARMYTDKFSVHIGLSILLAAISVVLGYAGAAWGPLYLGYENSLSAAGGVSVVSGALLGISVVIAPKYGMLARGMRQLDYKIEMEGEDLLAALYRQGEEGQVFSPPAESLWTRTLRLIAARRLLRAHLVKEVPDGFALTARGIEQGQRLVRHHRQWEHYLVEEVGLRIDHVHDTAMELEHVQADEISEKLDKLTEDVVADPHGKEIPGSET